MCKHWPIWWRNCNILRFSRPFQFASCSVDAALFRMRFNASSNRFLNSLIPCMHSLVTLQQKSYLVWRISISCTWVLTVAPNRPSGRSTRAQGGQPCLTCYYPKRTPECLHWWVGLTPLGICSFPCPTLNKIEPFWWMKFDLVSGRSVWPCHLMVMAGQFLGEFGHTLHVFLWLIFPDLISSRYGGVSLISPPRTLPTHWFCIRFHRSNSALTPHSSL